MIQFHAIGEGTCLGFGAAERISGDHHLESL